MRQFLVGESKHGGSTQDDHDPAGNTDSPGVFGLQVSVKKVSTITMYQLRLIKVLKMSLSTLQVETNCSRQHATSLKLQFSGG